MTTDSKAWPKTFLLGLYQQTIRDGCVRVSGLTKEKAISLTQAFYRFRRKVDKSASSYIEPEFQLTTVTSWTPDHNGSIYIVYSAMPDGEALPEVTSLDPSEAQHALPVPALDHDAPDLVLDVDEIDIADYVSNLRKPRPE